MAEKSAWWAANQAAGSAVMEPAPNSDLPRCSDVKWFLNISAEPAGQASGFTGAAPAGTAPRMAAAVRAAKGTTTRFIRLTDQPPRGSPTWAFEFEQRFGNSTGTRRSGPCHSNPRGPGPRYF